MRGGKLRCKISVERATEAKDAFGQAIATWAELYSRWAQIQFALGREFFFANTDSTETPVVFRIRWDDTTKTTKAKDRILYEGDYYDILSVIDPDAKRRELIIKAVLGSYDNP